VFINCLISLYAPILNDVVLGVGCTSTDPTTNGILYILIQGMITPAVMLVFVLLTYRRFKQSRQQVVSALRVHFIL
jgi:hypothetical protein